jgi:hypothetical protein
MRPFPFFRSFLVSACAFAGAGWFGYWLYSVAVSDWDTGFWFVILAALLGGWLFARYDRADAGESEVPSD